MKNLKKLTLTASRRKAWLCQMFTFCISPKGGTEYRPSFNHVTKGIWLLPTNIVSHERAAFALQYLQTILLK